MYIYIKLHTNVYVYLGSIPDLLVVSLTIKAQKVLVYRSNIYFNINADIIEATIVQSRFDVLRSPAVSTMGDKLDPMFNS